MNKQQLSNKIWESANKMRSKIEANEYKDYILGFIFYKYLSDKEIRFLEKEGLSKNEMKEILVEENTDSLEHISGEIGYFISYDNLFSTWLEMGKEFNVSNVHDALSAFNRLINKNHKKVFGGIFDILETGLSKLGENAIKQTKAISDLIHLIKDIPMDGKQDYDVLGYIYEDLISKFASNAGKKAGEFYTPHEVSILMSEIVAYHLKNREKIEIFDPTSGSGSLLINIGKSIGKYNKEENNIKYYAQELKRNTYNLTRMNLVMRGILPSNIVTRNADTLEDDWPYFEENDPIGTYSPLYVDAVVSNPPYSQHWDPNEKESDPRYARFGLAPKGKADYAFLLHDLYHIKPDGIMTIVLPHGVLFRGGEEGNIRKNLIENNHIDAIIGLPANIFFGTGIPTIIMVLKQKRDNTDTFIIDASKGFIKEGKNNKLQASDIKRIIDAMTERKDIKKFSRKISRDEIRENDYNLNIPRYVDSSDDFETWDIYSSMFGGIPIKEIESINEYWETFTNLKNDLFIEEGKEHLKLLSDDVKDTINNHKDVIDFKKEFINAFNGFNHTLKDRLINNMLTLNINSEEDIIADDIFNRLENISLIDKYKAYQLLDDNWINISSDLETIQTEGYECIREVNPNMVVKKKNNKEIEIQEGFVGKIIPFDLVHITLLKDDYDKLEKMKDDLNQAISEQQELFDSFTDEDKDEISDILNDDNSAFVSGSLTKFVKSLSKITNYDEESIEYRVIKIKNLKEDEKKLKKEIKEEEIRVHLLIKDMIESLSDEDINMLLTKKWIEPILNGLNNICDNIIDELYNKVKKLADKYDTTFSDIEEDIRKTEQELIKMIDELVGSETDMMGLQELKKILGGK